MDRFLQESCRSYKECEIKNTARRNSLQRRTLGIETERKLASANISREERHLREQLKMMKIEKAKNDMMHNMRGIVHMGGSRGDGGRGSGPPAKSQVAIGFIRNAGVDTLEKQLNTLGPIASQGRFVHPSVKYVDG